MYHRFQILIFLFILPFDVLGEIASSSCLDDKIDGIKLDIMKNSLEQVKSLYPKCRDPDDDLTKCGKKESALAYLHLTLETLGGLKGNLETKVCPKCPDPLKSSGPVDCAEVMKAGNLESGVYTIYPRNRENGTKALKVYCDMKTDGGGWTVIQRRGNFSQQENFHRDWEEYKQGFGNIQRDFWLGNDNIHTLTNQGVYSLHIDLVNNNGEYRYSFHDSFWIDNENNSYAIQVKKFSGNVSDGLTQQDGMKFSTKDRQNDGLQPNDACAVVFHGAWWYLPIQGCTYSNLNGLYIPGVNNRNSNWWWLWTGYVGLFSSEMKIRHRSDKI